MRDRNSKCGDSILPKFNNFWSYGTLSYAKKSVASIRWPYPTVEVITYKVEGHVFEYFIARPGLRVKAQETIFHEYRHDTPCPLYISIYYATASAFSRVMPFNVGTLVASRSRIVMQYDRHSQEVMGR